MAKIKEKNRILFQKEICSKKGQKNNPYNEEEAVTLQFKGEEELAMQQPV